MNTLSGCRFLSFDEILYFISSGIHANIVLLSGEQVATSKSIKFYDEFIDEGSFFRVDKSHIINCAFAKGLNGDKIIMANNFAVPISERKKIAFNHFMLNR